MTRPTIWIANDAGHPYYKALEHLPEASLKPLTIGSQVSPLNVDRLNQHLAEGIGRYAQEGDYLLLSGPLTINAFALALWLLRFGRVRILQWNAKSQSYENPLTVEEEHLREQLAKYL